jgi:uncharacterized protein (DUF4415 family)
MAQLLLDKITGPDGKPLQPRKVRVALYVDAATVDFFRDNGRDWRTRMSETLRQHVKSRKEKP